MNSIHFDQHIHSNIKKSPSKIHGNFNINYVCNFRGRKIMTFNEYTFIFIDSFGKKISVSGNEYSVLQNDNNEDYINLSPLTRYKDQNLYLHSIHIDFICKQVLANKNIFFNLNKIVIFNEKISVEKILKEYNKFLKKIN
jgi:hypothetical protein